MALAEPVADAYNAVRRGKWDYPTFDMLMERNVRERGMSPRDSFYRIISRTTNPKWTLIAKGVKIVGYIGLAFEAGRVLYKVQNAKGTERLSVAVQETSRFAGSVGFGYAGFMFGARVGGAVGALFPPPGLLIGAAIGGLIGGFLGAYCGGEAGATVGRHLLTGNDINVTPIGPSGRWKRVDESWAGPPLRR